MKPSDYVADAARGVLARIVSGEMIARRVEVSNYGTDNELRIEIDVVTISPPAGKDA